MLSLPEDCCQLRARSHEFNLPLISLVSAVSHRGRFGSASLQAPATPFLKDMSNASEGSQTACQEPVTMTSLPYCVAVWLFQNSFNKVSRFFYARLAHNARETDMEMKKGSERERAKEKRERLKAVEIRLHGLFLPFSPLMGKVMIKKLRETPLWLRGNTFSLFFPLQLSATHTSTKEPPPPPLCPPPLRLHFSLPLHLTAEM